jgi:hypothetical protein
MHGGTAAGAPSGPAATLPLAGATISLLTA